MRSSPRRSAPRVATPSASGPGPWGIKPEEREALIVGVVVRPAYQRKGIGSRMMAALTEQLKGTAILLTCEEDENVPFYEKAGFRTHKRVMALGYRDVYAEQG